MRKPEQSIRETAESGDDDATFAMTLAQLRDESQGSSELGLIIKTGSKPFLAVYAGDTRVIAQLMHLLHVAGMVDMDRIMAMADERADAVQA